MKNKPKTLLVALAVALSGCSTSHKDIAAISLGYANNPGKVSDSATFKASGLALEVANRHIPGSIPSAAGIGIYAALLLTSGSFQDLARNSNHFEVWMPASEAADETDAKLKMSALMESAIRKALLPSHQTKILEYENVSVLGVRERHRDILVGGPGCEKWSCMVIAPIPTDNALQWVGKMAKIDETEVPGGNAYYVYKGLQNLVFAKITREYEQDGVLAGHWHKLEGKISEGFDYEGFYRRISENLPAWAYYYISPGNSDDRLEGPAILNKGVKTKS